MKKLAVAVLLVCVVVICAMSFSGCSADDFGSTISGWFESVKTVVSDWVNSWFNGVDVDGVDFDIDHIIF